MSTQDPLPERDVRIPPIRPRGPEKLRAESFGDSPVKMTETSGDGVQTLFPGDAAAEAHTLGAAMRQTRLTRQLKVREVASQLHLSVDVINAIEEEQFAQLGAPIYARSYLSRYAKLLGLPRETVLARYDELKLGEPQLRVSHTPKTSSAVGDLRWLLYPVLALVVAWLLWLGVQQLLPMFDGDEPAAAQLGDDTALLLPGQSQQNLPPAPDTATALLPAQSVAVEIGTAADETAAGGAGARPLSAPPAALIPETTAGAFQPNAGTIGAADAATDTATDTATSAATAALSGPALANEQGYMDGVGASPASGDDRLNLRLSADCWVEINDADGRRLVYGLLAPGQHSAIGKLPFSVKLGNSTAAELSLNGSPVAPDIYRRERGVSRFVLRGGGD